MRAERAEMEVSNTPHPHYKNNKEDSMQIYELQASKVLEVQGDFICIGEEEGKIYVQAENLKKPFKPSHLPQRLQEQFAGELKKLRAQKEQEFNAKCDELLAHFESDALGESYMYDMALRDQINLLGLLLSKSDGFLRARKGEEPKANYPHTKAQISKLYADSLAHKNRILSQCGVLKSYLLELDSIEAINALSWEDYESIQGTN